MLRFVDTNIFVRYFTGQPPDKAEQANRLLQRVEDGRERVATSVMVVFETVFTLQRTYKVPKERIRELVGSVLSLPGIHLPGKRLLLMALDLYAETALSFADAYNVVYMQEMGIEEIYTWDTDFDRIPGVQRIEP